MAEVKPALKNIAKAILEQDHSRKQAAKWRNSSYEPWKKGVQTVKETPFGGFNGTAPKANKFLNTPFDFSSPKPEPSLGQASINVCKHPMITKYSTKPWLLKKQKLLA